MSDIERLEQEICLALEMAGDEQALEAVRIAALGKKGSISEKLKALGKMSASERQKVGPVLNGLKNRVLELWTQKRDFLRRQAMDACLTRETVDITLPVRSSPIERGRIHPISQVIEEIIAIYMKMGFSLAEGPDIETDYYNFTALNFPEGHPAREMHDTFFLMLIKRESGNYCAPIHRLYKFAQWKSRKHRYVSLFLEKRIVWIRMQHIHPCFIR